MTDRRSPPGRVEQSLAGWREAQRAADAAADERAAVERAAESVELVDEAVKRTAVEAAAVVEAAKQVERSAREAVEVVEEVSQDVREELHRSRSAEETALAASEAARAQHRQAQDSVISRYRDENGPPAEEGEPAPGDTLARP